MANKTNIKKNFKDIPARSERMKKLGNEQGAKNKADAERREEYKKETEAIKKTGCPLNTYTNPILMAFRLAKYIYDCRYYVDSEGDIKPKPYTRKGMQLACYLKKTAFEDYHRGDRDYLVTQKNNGEIPLSTTGLQTQSILDTPSELIDIMALLVGIPPELIKGALDGNLEALEIVKDIERRIFFSEVIDTACELMFEQREIDLYAKGRVADIFIAKNFLGMKDEQTITNRRLMIGGDEAKEMVKQLMGEAGD